MNVPAVANAFGICGAVCWSVQLLPQIYLNWRRHDATGLKPQFMLFWAFAGIPLGVYNIVSGFNVALRIQPQILTSLSLVTWGQVYHYEEKWTVSKALAVGIPLACFMGGLEAALILAMRIGISDGVHWPLTLMAVLAALLLALGVSEQYWDIWKHRSVRGISFLFCGIDALGDLTSIISVLFEPTLDILGLVIYSVELVLWIGIFACGGYYNLAPWLKQNNRRAKPTPPILTRDEGVSPAHELALHGVSSSSSVFRTPSAEHTARLRQDGTAQSLRSIDLRGHDAIVHGSAGDIEVGQASQT